MSSHNVRKALDARHGLVMMHAQDAGSLTPFIGTGLKDSLRSGWQKFKPIALDALSAAVKGFSKGFTEHSGDLGSKALSGLAAAGKAAATSAAVGVPALFGSGFMQEAEQKAKSKVHNRPKI